MKHLTIDPSFRAKMTSAYKEACAEIKSIADEITFAKRAKMGDLHAKDMLYNKFLPYIIDMAFNSKYSSFNGEASDLIASTAIGYETALRLFDPTLGNGFGAFFRNHVFNSMQKELYNDTLVHIPENLLKGSTHAENKRNNADIGSAEDNSLRSGKSYAQTIYADRPINGDAEDGGATLMDTFVSSFNSTEMENDIMHKEQVKVCKKVMDSLDERERKIIGELYLTETQETLRSVSVHCGLSHEAIRKIRDRALSKMKMATEDMAISICEVAVS